MLDKLTKAYPTLQVTETKSTSDGNNFVVDRIVINAEESPEDRDGFRIFDYWVEDYKEERYIFGIRKHLHNFLQRNGWYGEWVNPYTMALYKVN